MTEYTVKRYHDGRLKAEGAKVMANSAAEALEKAKALFTEPDLASDTYEIEEDFT